MTERDRKRIKTTHKIIMKLAWFESMKKGARWNT